MIIFQRLHLSGFPGGPVAGSPPANAGDTSSIPGQEDPTCVQGSWAHALLAAESEYLSLHVAAAELILCTMCFGSFSIFFFFFLEEN